MKRYKILTAVMAAALFGGASAMAQFNYQNGDMLAAFGSLSSTQDVVVDLGSIANFQVSGPATTYNLNGVLTSTFGSVNSGIYWAVFGANNTSQSSYNASVTQTSPDTMWNTLARINVNTPTTAPHVGGNAGLQALAVGDVGTIGNTTVPSQAGSGQIVDYAAGIELVNVSLGGFTSMMTSPYNGNFQGDWTYNVLNNGAGTSDLYQSNPGNHNTQTANLLGSVNLSSGGTLTFSPTPEPSTWAMIGSGALALLALRRRK